MLWQDEGETVCVAETVLTEGIPKGTDGKNFFSQQEGREYGENYEWKLHPWFQFYWLALFFSFFEPTTYIARFPFAILGIATVMFSFFLSMRLWNDKKTATFVAFAFLTNIMFLLLVRQARYYAPVMFFSVYATWGFLDILEQKKIGFFHFILASLLFFQSQYLFALNFWIACLIYSWVFHKEQFKKVGVAIAIAATPSIPFLFWVLDTPYGETLTDGSSSEAVSYGFGRFFKAFFDFVLEPIWLLILIPVYFIKDILKKSAINFQSERFLLFFLLIICGNITAIALFVPEYYIRYLCITIPFAIIIKGRISGWLSELHLGVPLILFLGLIIYKGDLLNYSKELFASSYTGPVESMVNFLKNEALKEDKIAISYGDLPLKYYLENPIYGGLAGDLPENLDSMDFIIVRRNSIDKMDQKVQIKLHEYIQLNLNKFKAYGLNVEDTPFQNREIPESHYYETPLVSNSLVIHKRIK